MWWDPAQRRPRPGHSQATGQSEAHQGHRQLHPGPRSCLITSWEGLVPATSRGMAKEGSWPSPCWVISTWKPFRRFWPPVSSSFQISLRSPFSSATWPSLLVWEPHFLNASWGFALYSACPSWSSSHLLGLKEYCLLSASKLMPVKELS
jgi:hypothetical protein